MTAKRATAEHTTRKRAPTKRKAPDKLVRSRNLRAADVAALRAAVVQGRASRTRRSRPRWNPDPEDVQQSVAQLVLALVEFVRKLLERQAIRRMEQGTLSTKEVEAVGGALMRLEETVHELARRFGIDPNDLNLDLGPLGRLH